MKIEQISVHSVLAVRAVEIKTDAPITLICGKNEVGKSSLRDAIYMAFTGTNPRAKILKKDLKVLVNDQQPDMRSAVGYAYVDYDGGQRACITLPNGTHELKGAPLHFALPHVLNPGSFTSLAPDERSKFLFELNNLSSGGKEVKEKLLKRGCNAQKVDQIMPFLMSSFENSEKKVLENVKQERSNWRGVTGEVYGDKKAVDWKAVKPHESNPEALTIAKRALVTIDQEIDDLNKSLGEKQAILRNEEKYQVEINNLRSMSERLDRITEKLAKDRQEAAIWSVKVNDARLLAQGSKPGSKPCTCPSCGTELMFDGAKLTERSGDLRGDEETAAKLPEYERTLEMLKKSVVNGERDLASAQYAQEKLAEIENQVRENVSEESIAAIKSELDQLRGHKKQAQQDCDLLNNNIRLANEADAKTAKAAMHHTDAQEWDLIATALSPDGIPGEMLSESLDPINARIAQSTQMLDWKPVVINPDMSISYEGRIYELSSQSAKWRINTVIAEAISHISGINALMVDEFDLLDLQSRNDVLEWLVTLASKGEIESAIVFGTLKKLPTGLPQEIAAHWIDGGVIVNHKDEAAA